MSRVELLHLVLLDLDPELERVSTLAEGDCHDLNFPKNQLAVYCRIAYRSGRPYCSSKIQGSQTLMHTLTPTRTETITVVESFVLDNSEKRVVAQTWFLCQQNQGFRKTFMLERHIDSLEAPIVHFGLFVDVSCGPSQNFDEKAFPRGVQRRFFSK